MIIPMVHITIAAHASDRDRLLESLRELGALHLVPVDNAPPAGGARSDADVQNARRALQIISAHIPEESDSELDGSEAVTRVLQIHKQLHDCEARLNALAQEAAGMEPWGHTLPQQIHDLADAGAEVALVVVPDEQAGLCRAEVVHLMGRAERGLTLVALVNPVELPPDAERIDPPRRSRSSILSDAAETRREIEDLHAELGRLASVQPAIASQLRAALAREEWQDAVDGSHADEDIFAVQGWMPRPLAERIDTELIQRGLTVAVSRSEPDPEVTPPTAIEPPRWARPIQALFRMLGTVPGYREFDVSVPFMIALPLFAAILIGDGGYGLLLILAAVLARDWMKRAAGSEATLLVLLIGIASFAWGIISSNFFGFRLFQPLIPVDLTEYSRNLMMLISFILGAVHLTFAQLWQSVTYFPDRRFLGRLGWALFIWGMFGVVLHFVLGYGFGWDRPWPFFLVAGASLAILFARKEPTLIRSLALGIADFPLRMISAFSDVISYVRLMAVGLATTVLAVAFNDMAIAAGILPFGMFIFLLGHALNFGLVIIAIFAHGVRLNMLEFSTNLGMQWSGYPFRPFGARFQK